MFILSLNYIKPLEVVEQFLPGHRQFLDTYINRKNSYYQDRKNLGPVV